jgi:[NiFe] hydrogenase diaphorase moiety large subunit
MKKRILSIIENYGKDADRMMDILLDIQTEFGCVSVEAVGLLADKLMVSEADVMQTLSFYHFFTQKPVGKYAVYLNNSVVSCMNGMADVADEFEKNTGIKFGNTTSDGQIGLYYTACIGMSDQEPAALINSVVFTQLSREKVRKLVADMKAGKKVSEMFTEYGDGNNSHPLVKSMVKNNIRKDGPVALGEYTAGTGLAKALGMEPKYVINEIKESKLRGRGGAGFPTGMKWDFCSREQGERYVLCNADEGEPGTFKDRVLLTERASMMFEGMAVAAYAIGAKTGILYLRNEYLYLKKYLDYTLDELKKKNLLGKNIMGRGFDFDIRIQLGAGAYVCGEESAMIESAEGKRGEPRNRPPFPVQKGYKSSPSIVNNVETYCAAVKIMENGSKWYNDMGTPESAGTKLLSISGDCKYPGIYEIEWGISIKDMLIMVGADDVQALQVAGPSGVCLDPSQFDRKISFEDLPTGGSMIVIGKNCDLLKDVVLNFMHFFADESCGSCVTCRSFNMILKNAIEKIVNGRGIKKDIDDIIAWSDILQKTTRCGLGQTSSNPITTTVKNFRQLYEKRVKHTDYHSEFDLQKAVIESCETVGRNSAVHE